MGMTTYPELEAPDVQRPLAGVVYPHESLRESYQPGTTESYVAQLAASFAVALGAQRILETGGFQGTTSAWLALTLERMGGGTLDVCEIDPVRAKAIRERLDGLEIPRVLDAVLPIDVLQHVRSTRDEFYDLVWLDDDHRDAHVAREVEAIWPKVRKGGLILFHDIDEPCNLHEVVTRYGGYAIRLPKLGPSGGVGVLQVP
jgi:predicted O-methyltransferase YrrM